MTLNIINEIMAKLEDNLPTPEEKLDVAVCLIATIASRFAGEDEERVYEEIEWQYNSETK